MVRFEALDPEIRGVLGKKVSELGLRVEGSPVEGYVRQLYRELERRGLKKFRPVCYLTDEWGCPDQQPVLGIPFYLADPKLRKLEKAVDALENEREVIGCQGVFNMSPTNHNGMDERARVLITVRDGKFRLLPE